MCDECELAAPPYGGGSVLRIWFDVTRCTDDGHVTVRAWCSGRDGITRRHDALDIPQEGERHASDQIAQMVDNWLAWGCGHGAGWPPPSS